MLPINIAANEHMQGRRLLKYIILLNPQSKQKMNQTLIVSVIHGQNYGV